MKTKKNPLLYFCIGMIALFSPLFITDVAAMDVGSKEISVLTPGSREIPFWEDKVEGNKYKPASFDEDSVDAKVNEIGLREEDGTYDNWGVDGKGVRTMREKTETFVKGISGIIFGLAVIMVVFAGFKYATSEGDTRKMSQAKMQIIYAGIGIGLAVFNYVFLNLIKEIFNAAV